MRSDAEWLWHLERQATILDARVDDLARCSGSPSDVVEAVYAAVKAERAYLSITAACPLPLLLRYASTRAQARRA